MNAFGWNETQLEKMRTQPGFVAALDQSGGSTPKTLAAYGIPEGAWTDEAGMFGLAHQMRTRIMTSPGFTGGRILGAILFADTMAREIQGRPAADYLWNIRRIVPFLKVDQGLAEERDGARLMKPMPRLPALLEQARVNGIFGTKMRSFIRQASSGGIQAIVEQQFIVGAQILAVGLVPILEPEVDIHCPQKARAEELLRADLRGRLDQLPDGQLVLLKLTLPEQDGFYSEFVNHPRVARVVALSGGYSRTEANDRLRRQPGVVASFSRALFEGLRVEQPEAEFNTLLEASIQSIFEASTVKQP